MSTVSARTHPAMRELDEALLLRANRVFVDNRATVLAEAGDFAQPIARGIFGPDSIDGELGEVIEGGDAGRSAAGEITAFKSVEFASLDVVAAREIYAKAIAAGIGTSIDL